MSDLIVILASYLVGSITFGPIVAARYGVDLRATGSGNIGATNTLRALGRGPALIVLAGDLLKGVAGAGLGAVFGGDMFVRGGAALAAVVGHDFPVFSRFRGGKGVATTLGALAVYSPLAAGGAVLVWLVVFAIVRVSSAAALSALAVMPAIIYLDAPEKTGFGVALTVLGVLKHRDNVRRLIRHEEHGFGKRQ